MTRNTYTGRDGLPYFFPVLDDDLADLPDSDSSSQNGIAAFEADRRPGQEQAVSWSQQVIPVRADGMNDRGDPLLLRGSLQPDLPFNSWQRYEMRDVNQEPAKWGEYDGEVMDAAMHPNEQDQAGAAAGYTGADVLQRHRKPLELPPPGLTREQEVIWLQRQVFKNDLGLDVSRLPEVDYADFARKGSQYYSQVSPEDIGKIRASIAAHIANSPEPRPGSIREWNGPQLGNLQNLNITDNVLSAKAALECIGTVPDCDLAVKQLNLINGKDGKYGMNVDFHLAQKDEPVAFKMNVMDDEAFRKKVAENRRLPKNTGGYWDSNDLTMYLPRGRNFNVTGHEVLHALGRGHDEFKYIDPAMRPGIMSYASDIIRSPRPVERDYKILVDNYRDYPAKVPRSIWDFWRK
ncbi:hypothetical protein UNDKW_3886 [Undibacterium sp. KW1]|uniref:hypothetical protein n=1 Tax=Undibacterium sp. KW1 TaxID=2058624 RepID=UPI001331CEA4|nr:hypothetical protein [Undibacterium sp. KW1]BBB62159.1 hypothetical protein UNDKW_3886 [Undibacterium sp. KW1]